MVKISSIFAAFIENTNFKLKNDNFKTRDSSPLIERVLAGVQFLLHNSYSKVTSSNTSSLEANASFFRFLMKGIVYCDLLKNTVFHHIVSALEYVPSLNTFLSNKSVY